VKAGRNLVALLAASSVLVAGCSRSGHQGTIISVHGFGDATTQARTARFAADRTNDDEDQGGPPSRAVGTFDFESSNGTMTEGTTGDTKTLELVVGGAAYMPMTAAGPIPTNDPCYGKKWAVFDYPKYAKEGLVSASKMSPVPLDPGRIVTALRNADGTLTKIGSERVRGTLTDHYQVSAGSPALQQAFTENNEISDQRLDALDVWVDADQRLRRVRSIVTVRWGNSSPSVSGPYAHVDGGTYKQTTTVDVWDYGVPVNVQRPPDSEACDFPEFFQRTMNTFDHPGPTP